MTDAHVLAVARCEQHSFGKRLCPAIRLIAGIGVQGDVHAGPTVRHRSRIARTPHVPNLRQVHLIHSELLAELAIAGFAVLPGQLGENITTRGIDLPSLGRGTQLQLGADAVIEITGLRNPCRQIDENVAPGAMAAMIERRSDRSLRRKAGVMAVVLASGEVREGDPVTVAFVPPDAPALEPV